MGFDFFRYDLIWGGAENMKSTRDDVYTLARELKEASMKPEAYVYCGIENVTSYSMNLRFYETLKESGFRAFFTDGHGLHNRAYWDTCIADFLKKAGGERSR